MNVSFIESLRGKLYRFEQHIRKRDLLGKSAYTLSLVTLMSPISLPSDLSRVGVVVMIVSMAYMISKLRAARPKNLPMPTVFAGDYLRAELERVNAQIALAQSAFYHLPFLVGANLFLMGLPYTENPVTKAVLDCLFLGATFLVFLILYLANQQMLRRQLLPLQRELEWAAGEQGRSE